MEVKQFARQMIEFQQATFNNTFNTIGMVQDQSEKMVNTFMDQNPMLPKQGRDAFNEWLKVCKKAREDYKKAIDAGFKNLEGYLAEAPKS
ncbi:MAG: hypothetical protein JW781_05990 [Deltaproteobacteria bacterium]|nr:hypothetical protein [Candidatus Anaeroferrophillacea bacterium]